jgi:hypothetical protein
VAETATVPKVVPPAVVIMGAAALKVAAVPWKTLRSRRGKILLPHSFLAPLRASLVETRDLVQAIADALDDSRWQRAADALDRAADALRDVTR